MANPVFNEGTLQDAITKAREEQSSGVMTARGAFGAATMLLVLLFAAAVFGWSTVVPSTVATGFPSFVLPLVFVGMGISFGIRFKPTWAMFLAPIYAVVEGIFVGALSHVYDTMYKGVVASAVFATIATFAAMLTLYSTGVIKVTDRYRTIIGGATLGLGILYLVSFILSMFHVNVPIIHDSNPVGILFSVLAAGLAAFRLNVDFDNIKKGIQYGAPKHQEWVSAFGLVVTLVWLYLEILRLLAKLQRR